MAACIERYAMQYRSKGRVVMSGFASATKCRGCWSVDNRIGTLCRKPDHRVDEGVGVFCVCGNHLTLGDYVRN